MGAISSSSETKRVLVLHVPAGGGHKAAAMALAERARGRGLDPVVLDVLELSPRWFARAYVETHLGASAHLPTFYGGAYFASNRRSPLAGELRHAFDHVVLGPLLARVAALQPDAIVATHFQPLALLACARRKGWLSAPVVGVVTDYAAHAVWAEPGLDRYCAAPGGACADLARHGAAADRIVATGIPVRAAFGRIAPMLPPRPREKPRVLVTSGGFGVGPLAKVLRSFAGVDATLTVVCGRNPSLVARAERIAAEHGLDARVVGFEADMASRMAEAHLVVGKPGGLTVSEALAAGRPLVLVGAVPGQETSNQRWLVARGAAVQARAREVGGVVAALCESDAIAAMAARSRGLGAPNAADRVLDATLACVVHRARRAA